MTKNIVLLTTGLILVQLSCTTGEKQEKITESQTVLDSGEFLARKYCGSCHAFSSPDLLDKKTWVNHVLPAMGYRFGIYDDRSRDSLIEKGIGGRIVTQSNIFPLEQSITDEHWKQIIQYYDEEAPDKLTLPADTLSTKIAAPFDVMVPNFKIERPAVTAIAYDDKGRRLYVGDCSRENFSSVTILDSSLKPLTSLGLPFPVSNLTLRDDTLYILMMGHFVPSDEPAGQLVKAVKNNKGDYSGYKMVLKGLKRPVDVAYTDIDDDGDEDIIVCEFGNHTGSVSVFFRQGKRYEKKILLDAPGAIDVIVDDINRDSKRDIMILMAQGDEGVDIYYNEGNGQFKKERVLQFPPVYGSVSLCLQDVNRDGFKDIVYVNGDNADASQIIKPYHGIRLFLNDQYNRFIDSYFYFFPGAYKAIVTDVDNDGDFDIAAISFFPDFRDMMNGFVYLENVSEQAQLKFAPSNLPDIPMGRWMAMTNADVDKDGKEDLLLGSFTSMDIQGDTLKTLKTKLQHESVPMLLLRNLTNKK